MKAKKYYYTAHRPSFHLKEISKNLGVERCIRINFCVPITSPSRGCVCSICTTDEPFHGVPANSCAKSVIRNSEEDSTLVLIVQ